MVIMSVSKTEDGCSIHSQPVFKNSCYFTLKVLKMDLKTKIKKFETLKEKFTKPVLNNRKEVVGYEFCKDDFELFLLFSIHNELENLVWK